MAFNNGLRSASKLLASSESFLPKSGPSLNSIFARIHILFFFLFWSIEEGIFIIMGRNYIEPVFLDEKME